jgi:predicted PurR-regulated permease PerM
MLERWRMQRRAAKEARRRGAPPASDEQLPTGDASASAEVPSAPGRDTPRALILWTLVMTAVVAAVVWALVLARQSLLLIYVSVLLAIGFSPLVQLIEGLKLLPIGQRLPRWLAILIVYFSIAAVVIGIGFTVFPPLVRQAQGFTTHFPQMLEQAQAYLVKRGILTQRMTFADIVQQTPGSADAFNTIVGTFGGLIGGAFGVVTILFLTFYLLVEEEVFFDAFVRLFPPGRRAQVREVSRQITYKVSRWLSGQLILAAFIGVTSAVGLGLIGIPYFYVLAVIAAVGELIPFLGPVLAAIPGIIVALTISWKLAIGVAIYYLAQQLFESNILVPKLMSHQVGLSAAGIIIALLIGFSLLGILGAILAVPTAAILQVVFQELRPSDR